MHIYQPRTYFQNLLFTNECTSDVLKNNIKIYVKKAPTCFSAVTLFGCKLQSTP